MHLGRKVQASYRCKWRRVGVTWLLGHRSSTCLPSSALLPLDGRSLGMTIMTTLGHLPVLSLTGACRKSEIRVLIKKIVVNGSGGPSSTSFPSLTVPVGLWPVGT